MATALKTLKLGVSLMASYAAAHPGEAEPRRVFGYALLQLIEARTDPELLLQVAAALSGRPTAP